MIQLNRGRARLVTGAAALAVAGVIGPVAAVASPAQQAAVASPAQQAAKAQPAVPAVASGDTPAGFWYGTDSSNVATPGSGPFSEPAIGGAYGGYIGMIGNWSHWQHCGTQFIWSATDSNNAYTDHVTYHAGIGAGGYWFMGGPGVDPHYNGTTAEATTWGEQQAARAIADLPTLPTPVNYPVIFMDIELPGNAPSFTPAPDNGWNSVYTSTCSGTVRTSFVPTSLDRADLNGFATYLTTHSVYRAGVYSAPSIWGSIFGTGADSLIPNTYEWTYNGLTSSLAHKPADWCLSGTSTCAEFFGGQTSASNFALMWQWSGGGGTSNGIGDFDQIDENRTPQPS